MYVCFVSVIKTAFNTLLKGFLLMQIYNQKIDFANILKTFLHFDGVFMRLGVRVTGTPKGITARVLLGVTGVYWGRS